MQRAVIGCGDRTEDDPRGLVDIRGALCNRCGGTGNPGRPSGPGLQALTEADFDIGEAADGALPIAETHVDFGVRLKTHRRTEQPAACFLQRETCTHDLRRLRARAREHVRECQRAALGAGGSNLHAHRRAHRDGTTSNAHDNSSGSTL
jgi:hypothetical protein